MTESFQVDPAAFWILSALTLLAAVAVVSTPNIFHAGIYLIFSFLGVAGLYVTLQATFVAGMQVLVYAGAIAVILLFGFMLTHNLMHPELGTLFTQRWLGLALSALLLAASGAALALSTFHTQPDAAEAARVVSLTGLGQALLGPYVLPFELVSVLILAALVGAVVVARKEARP
ncbi:MAG TPA: NADH-quinone oxidoreductase subunit J [Candidatus Nitrosotenuis sp.]|nr:NADH-quinone oxidoreductase subunit J [Candidatus Nitrosotenuis sp.]